jgi:hypothetical protein
MNYKYNIYKIKNKNYYNLLINYKYQINKIYKDRNIKQNNYIKYK